MMYHTYRNSKYIIYSRFLKISLVSLVARLGAFRHHRRVITLPHLFCKSAKNLIHSHNAHANAPNDLKFGMTHNSKLGNRMVMLIVTYVNHFQRYCACTIRKYTEM